MSNKREGRVFAVVIMAAFGLMATMASAASAQWLESGVTIASNKLVEVSEHTDHFTLDVPSKNYEVLCQGVAGIDVLLIAGSLTEARGTLLYSGCELLSKGVLQKNCTLDHVTYDFKSLLIVHSSRTYVLFEPLTPGGTSAVILSLGELCPFPEKINVNGTVVAECLTTELAEKDCLTAAVTHLLREALNAATLFPSDGITVSGVPANVLGVGAVKLASGNSWTGHL